MANNERYSRQVRFAAIGSEGQTRLRDARVAICGVGALGTVLAESMVRAGIGYVKLIDRDFVELSNLQRQVLFDEQDAEESRPKAIAAAERLREINSDIEIDPIVADFRHDNALELTDQIDLILDGTDNFETRFLINDVALETNTPWMFSGVVAANGQFMPVIPDHTACLRCLMEEPPGHAEGETCDTAGVIGPAINVIASLSAATALKLLTQGTNAISNELLIVDVWDLTFRKLSMPTPGTTCPGCGEGKRDWLSGKRGSETTVLCGRNSVQIHPPDQDSIDLIKLANRLKQTVPVTRTPYLLRISVDTERVITLFPDGRAIISGTDDPAIARTLLAKFIGM
ncbi:ThiF family adenylyltransferase [Calycomorphotria hydatis]|uniref:Sulfur carrier protein ThiS adenylyltransferase n=1 Tax=Calycomorphotria hydatis TaxID=2528027 RepID=A0A517TFC4_9PLAN|nr:ThiF family adenylyltransferase [Calycomorphotria hydatis]QDT67058.1 Sulfur carrier protein ThiS adenylyltransferase [Calycomorphotria hydatis]